MAASHIYLIFNIYMLINSYPPKQCLFIVGALVNSMPSDTVLLVVILSALLIVFLLNLYIYRKIFANLGKIKLKKPVNKLYQVGQVKQSFTYFLLFGIENEPDSLQRLRGFFLLTWLIVLVLFGYLGYFADSHSSIETSTPVNDSTFMFSRGACFGTCPIYTFVIYEDGSAYYEGIRYVEKQGFYKGQISRADVQRLTQLFLNRNYIGLDEKYTYPITDMPSVSTGFQYGGKSKTIYNYADSGPRNLEFLENELDAVGMKINWKPITVDKEVCDKLYAAEWGKSNALASCYKKISEFSCSEVGVKLERGCYQRLDEENSLLHLQYTNNGGQIKSIMGMPYNTSINLSRYIDEDLTANNTLKPFDAPTEVLYHGATVTCNFGLPPCSDVEQFNLNFSKIEIEVDLSGNFDTSVRNVGPYNLKKPGISMWISRINKTNNKPYEELVYDGCISGTGDGSIYSVCYMYYNASGGFYPPPADYVVFTEEEKANIFFKYRGERIKHVRVPYFSHTTPYIPPKTSSR